MTCSIHIPYYGDMVYRQSDGKRHREDGPAIEFISGAKQWFINDKLHREDSPAVMFHDGTFYWYLDHKQVFPSSNEEFIRLVKLKTFW